MSFPPLLPQDKANHSHYGAEAAFSVACALLLLGYFHPPARLSLLTVAFLALGATFVSAALKELADSRDREHHTPEWADFLYTVRGGLHVAVPLILLEALWRT
jgi:hypothetical protein